MLNLQNKTTRKKYPCKHQEIQNKIADIKYSCLTYKTKLPVKNTTEWLTNQFTFLYFWLHTHGRIFQAYLPVQFELLWRLIKILMQTFRKSRTKVQVQLHFLLHPSENPKENYRYKILLHFLQHKTTCETYSCMTYKSINFTIFMFTYSWLNISSTFIVWVIVRVNQNLHANIQKIQNKSTGTKYSCNYYNTKLLVQNTFVWHRYQTTLLYLLVHNHGRTYQTQLE